MSFYIRSNYKKPQIGDKVKASITVLQGSTDKRLIKSGLIYEVIAGDWTRVFGYDSNDYVFVMSEQGTQQLLRLDNFEIIREYKLPEELFTL